MNVNNGPFSHETLIETLLKIILIFLSFHFPHFPVDHLNPFSHKSSICLFALWQNLPATTALLGIWRIIIVGDFFPSCISTATANFWCQRKCFDFLRNKTKVAGRYSNRKSLVLYQLWKEASVPEWHLYFPICQYSLCYRSL